MPQTPYGRLLGAHLWSEKSLCPAPLRNRLICFGAQSKALLFSNRFAAKPAIVLIILLAPPTSGFTLLHLASADVMNLDNAGDLAFAPRSRADHIATGTKLAGTLTTVIEPLIEAQRRAFTGEKQPVTLAARHRQFDRAISEQLRPGQVLYRNAASPPLLRGEGARRHRRARRDRHPRPGRRIFRHLLGRCSRWRQQQRNGNEGGKRWM